MITYQKNISLKDLTTLHIGGAAQFYVCVSTIRELEEACTSAHENDLAITVLGGGSNVLIADEGINGLVIKMDIKGISFEEAGDATLVRVAAGEKWDDVVKLVTDKELWGIENLSGIPGSVGAAPIQNINAYGVSVADSIVEVVAYHRATGETKRLSREECMFAYRDSFFKSTEGREYIVVEVLFSLSPRKDVHASYVSASQSIERHLASQGITDPKPSDVRNTVLAIRKNIGMLEGIYRSAGSFFKNTVIAGDQFEWLLSIVEERHNSKSVKLSPWYWELEDGTIKVSTAFLMECTAYNKTDFKGETFNGTVGISPVHTLSLINVNDATASDMNAFVEIICNAVHDEFDVTIEPEVCILT